MGADTVIRVEDTDREETDTGNLQIYTDRDRGRHVRRAVQDWPEGAIAQKSGAGIGPGQVAVLAAARVSMVSVHRRPTVAILASGDELVDLDLWSWVLADAQAVYAIDQARSPATTRGYTVLGLLEMRRTNDAA